MAYPPPNPGGYPGYPPPPGGMPGSGYPPQPQGSPWVPGGSAAAPYPAQPTIPTPGGGGGGGLGFGSAPGYPPQNPTSTYPPPFPSSQPPPSTYPPPPTSTYPPPPTSTYPPPPTSHYPPPPTSTYPPPPSHYPPPPTSANPPPPSHYPPPPSQYGVGYPTPGEYPPQPTPPGVFTPPQPVPGGPVQYSTPQFPPPHPPTSHMAPPTDQMAAMAVSSSSSSKQKSTSSTSSSTSAPRNVPKRGTVKPHSPFNAEEDARKLRTAMKGLGTDEKAIISVLAYRSNSQRQQIKIKFKSMFGKDLIADLCSELSGHLEEVVLGLMMTPPEYDASAVYNAIKGLGTDESTLIEILCTRSNDEIQDLKRQYKSAYGKDVEKDVASDTSGHFKRLLTSLLTGARERDGSVDQERAKADAQALYRAGEARWGTDESMFNQVMASRSFSHLRVVFQEYSKTCKYDIEQSISREMSGDLKTCMITVVKCVRDKAGYFAERLYKSMKGLGTDDRTLVRVMVTRCEVDMEDIKEKFYRNYHKHLGSFIKGDTSGDYRRILMALAGPDND